MVLRYLCCYCLEMHTYSNNQRVVNYLGDVWILVEFSSIDLNFVNRKELIGTVVIQDSRFKASTSVVFNIDLQ